MLGKIQYTYNGYTLNNDAVKPWAALEKVSGLRDIQLRQSRREKTGDHGIIDYDTYAGGRTISFEGLLIGRTEVEVAAIITSFQNAFVIEPNPTPVAQGERLLTWQDDNEVAKQILCKVDRMPVIDEIMYGTLFRPFFVSLFAKDPRIVSQALNTNTLYLAYPTGLLTFPVLFPLTFGSGYANEEVLANAGNFSANISYTITVPVGYQVVNPEILNVTTGVFQKFYPLTLAENDVLTVTPTSATWYDASAGTTTDVLGLITAESSTVYLAAGNNYIDFLDDTSDPTDPAFTGDTGSFNFLNVVITWRDTWI